MRLGEITSLRCIAAAGALMMPLLTSQPALAGTSDMGSITTVLPHSGGGLFFNSTGTRHSAPACATQVNRWVINVTTPQGQAMVAALLSAYMAHKSIYVQGTGDCGVWGDTETVNYFVIAD